MHSMTGFGSAKVTSSPLVFYIQVKSVNSRFFDLKLHIPPYLTSIESDLRSLLQNQFHRGAVELYIRSEIQDLGVSKVPQFNIALIKHYIQSIMKAQKQVGSGVAKAQIGWTELLRLPDVIRLEVAQELSSTQKKALLKGLKVAAEGCLKERVREGKILKSHLSKILEQLQNFLINIQDRSDVGSRVNPPEAYRDRIKSVLDKKGIELSEEKLIEEWAYFRERSAIFEELERLGSHLENINKLFNTSEPVGKRLDFYTQELLREFNTIGSKTSQSEVTQLVVESKNLIERLKEQVQNIE